MKHGTVGRIVQNGEFCFELGTHSITSGETEPCLAVGHIKQVAFRDDFFIEDMAYSFLSEANVEYQAKEPFIEILYLDSIDALNCEQGNDVVAIRDGAYIHFHQECRGELKFLADTPVRGIRIVIKNRFLSDQLLDKFPKGALDFLLLDELKNQCLQNHRLLIVFRQLRDSVRADTRSYAYYESKIIELLCIFAELSDSPREKRRLPDADKSAVETVRAILEERFSDAPKIAQLSVMTGTSPVKLQNDFKAAFGCTIHDYLRTVRITKALYMVEQTEIPLYAIAKKVGIRSPSHFSAMFKGAYGITPDVYRRSFHE
jgi:AraC-like DNA-binding protein